MRWRFCPWCAAPQRLKLVEFFRSHPHFDSERGKALRVSRYLGADDEERQVRFSVWKDMAQSAEAEAAVSLDDMEAERLARFLLNASSEVGTTRQSYPPGSRSTSELEPGI
jgi:hypothetical protein